MKIWNVKQNSEQWEVLRRGLPTASEFHKIICPGMGKVYVCGSCKAESPRARKKCGECSSPDITAQAIVKPSSQADDYMYRLIAESMSGLSLSVAPTPWMEHGHDTEAAAVGEYEFQSGNSTAVVGLCTTDDGLIGASPDRLVGDDGLLECKCPSPWVHIRHLCTGDLEEDHKVQVQGQMLVTGRQWVDVISYSRDFPAIITRVNRDEEYIGGMNALLVKFVEKLHRTRAELIAQYGDFRARKPAPEIDPLGFDVTAEDAERMYAKSREARA